MKNENQLTSSFHRAVFEYQREICVFLFVFSHSPRKVLSHFSIAVAERSGDKFQALT